MSKMNIRDNAFERAEFMNSLSNEFNQENYQMSMMNKPINSFRNDDVSLKPNVQKKVDTSYQSGIAFGVGNNFLQLQIPNVEALKHEINVNPKFLNSLINLMDKYGITFNAPFSINDNNNCNIENGKNHNNNGKSNQDTNNEPNQSIKSENKIAKTYQKFSQNEDQILKNIVSIFGPKNWKLIASMVPNKTPRQCRDRYMNYLAPGFIHSEWTSEEDRLLIEKYNEFGPCWTKIQQYFPFRTANSIKNRYNYTISKFDKLLDSYLGNHRKKSAEQKSDDLRLELKDEKNNFENINIQIQDNEINQDEEIQNLFNTDFEYAQNYFDF